MTTIDESIACAADATERATQALLGELLIAEPEQARDVLRVVRVADIHGAHYRQALQAIQDVLERDGAIDIVMVHAELAASWSAPVALNAFLPSIMAAGTRAVNLRHHARIVATAAAMRTEREAAAELVTAQTDEARRRAKRRIEAAGERIAKVQAWEDEADGPRPLDGLDDAAAMAEEAEDPPPEPLVEHLIVRPGVVILYGASGSGKSWALMAALYDLVMGGGTFCGVDALQIRSRSTRFGDEPDRVLWVYGSEDNRRRIKRRLRACGQHGPHAGKPIPDGRFVSATPPAGLCIASADGMVWLERAVAQTRATVLVLDTIQSLVTTIDTSKGEQVAPFMRRLHALRDAHDLVVIPLHHTSKASTDAKAKLRSKADTLLGSQAWRALADGLVMLDAVDGDASDAELRLIKGKDIDEPTGAIRLTMIGDSKRFRPLADGEEPSARVAARNAADAAEAGFGATPRHDHAETPTGARPGRKPVVDVDAIERLRRRNPNGVEWAAVWERIGVGRSTWFRGRADAQAELLRRGHVVVGGVLKWAAATPEEESRNQSRNSPETPHFGISGHPSVPESRNPVPISPLKGGISGTGIAGQALGADGPKLLNRDSESFGTGTGPEQPTDAAADGSGEDWIDRL